MSTSKANWERPLEAIFQRRAVKVFEPVGIPQAQRELILKVARLALSSFNMQPYPFYWVESPSMRTRAAQLCMGQSPAKTASALVVAVADIGSWRSTTQSYLEWVCQRGFSCERVSEYERKAKFGKWFFIQGWFGVLGIIKWITLRAMNLSRIIGTPPVSRQGLFKMGVEEYILGL